MPDNLINFNSEDIERLEKFLVDRIYEFNARTIDRFDAKPLCAAILDVYGRIIAAINGYSWVGCCQITHLWVRAGERGRGLGRKLLSGAEAEAMRRCCQIIQVCTHSFQSPGFCECLGYTRQAAVADSPVGHSSIFFAKTLKATT
jgi:GNAT superfamily N-acetyltransferase